MSASSARVRHIVELVADLSDEERSELNAELEGLDVAVGQAWGEEIDRRAERALIGKSRPLTREQLAALLEADPADARAQLSRVLPSRR
jgi:hypothetical protein